MMLSRKYFSIKANSLLESVLALTLISVCFFVAIMVYSAVFSPKTSLQFYTGQNKTNEIFYIWQVGHDSLTGTFNHTQWNIEEEYVGKVKKLTVTFNDSANVKTVKTYFVANEENK